MIQKSDPKRNFDTGFEISSVGIPEISPYTKFHQNRTINEEIHFFEGQGGRGRIQSRGMGGISKEKKGKRHKCPPKINLRSNFQLNCSMGKCWKNRGSG